MKGYPNVKIYPPWTVETCICSIGRYRPDCPYAKDEFLLPQTDIYNDLPNPEDLII